MTTKKRTPIEGDIVHYNSGDTRHRAAIITRVVDEEKKIVELHVFAMEHDPRPASLWTAYGEPDDIGKWHWIEKG